MGCGSKLGFLLAVAVGVVAVLKIKGSLSWDKEALFEFFRHMSDWLGNWAIPVYLGIHTISIAFCLPYAVFFEAGASLLFGFFPALLCVFSAKVLGASLSFWIGRQTQPYLMWDHDSHFSRSSPTREVEKSLQGT